MGLRFVTFLVSVTGFQVPGRPEEALFRPRPGPSFSAVPPESGAPNARAEEAASRSNQTFSLGFLSRIQPGLSKSCGGAFRSPRPSPKPGQADRTSEDSLQLDIQKLKEKKDMLDKEISQLLSEGYSVDELEDHISQLQEYNDIKDAAQMLLGRLAVIRGVTTKELYPEFGLDMND
ncbi:PREDICTED: DNA repair protein SWI5 homolog [Bison bison bison]|uniref:DNA repair protein SWI5 homolog n=1 Tax=Bison bison bison TaxID=43346 RepID=A0A6P3ILV5_BISBB|nr:PREDICTED: DNA repair protein SWI5 homolog [Bison bison bison]